MVNLASTLAFLTSSRFFAATFSGQMSHQLPLIAMGIRKLNPWLVTSGANWEYQ